MRAVKNNFRLMLISIDLLEKKKTLFKQTRTTMHGLNYSNKPIIQHVNEAMKLTYTRIVAMPSTIALEIDHAIASETKATSYVLSMKIKANIYRKNRNPSVRHCFLFISLTFCISWYWL